jgi:hypothetical protein
MCMENLVFQETFGRLLGSTEIWLAVAYVVCMFAILAFRPEQIENAGLFRTSYILFALFLILPSVINAFLSLSLRDVGVGHRGGETAILLLQVSGVFGKVLLGASVACALGSMRRYKATEERWDGGDDNNERRP